MEPAAETRSNGYAWRILLGPCHDWPVLASESYAAANLYPDIERCELCREPIDGSKPFTTNSAGQQPIHTACQGVGQELVASRPVFTFWRSWFRKVFGSRRHPSLLPVRIK